MPSAVPKTPSVVSHRCVSALPNDAPLCAISSGMLAPKKM